MKSVKRVGLYVRLSDEDRHKKDKTIDSESIANQKSMLLKYALDQGWEVVNIYSDDNFSGADNNRPQFNKMIKDCEKGLIDIVLCKTQSRFSRDMEIVEKYLHNKFVEWGVRFVSVVDNADTEIHSNKKSRQINGLINEWYLEDLSDNIRSSLQNKREDGLFLGSFAPYGYLKDPNNKNKLIVDPIASEVVKEIFALYKSGMGYYKIAQHLNAKNILTPTNYKKENGSKFATRSAKFGKNAKWTQDTIARMLRNEVYIGNLAQGRTTYVSYKNHKQINKPKSEWTYCYNTHEPIVDKDTWDYIQEKFKSRVRVSRTTGKIYMLSQKVFCKECGYVFTRDIYHTKDGKTYYMRCKGKRKLNINCDNKYSIRCDELEKIILDEINKQLKLYYSIDELNREYEIRKKALNGNLLTKKESLELEKNSLQQKIEKKNSHFKIMYDDRLNGIISQKDFIIFREKNIKEINEYEQRKNIIDKELSKIENDEVNIKSSQEIFEKYKYIEKLNKKIIDEFIDVIKIGKVDLCTKTRNIDIYFNIIKLD